MFICTWFLLWHPPVQVRTPLQGGAKKRQGGAKNFRLASLASRTPLSKTLKPPLSVSIIFTDPIKKAKDPANPDLHHWN
jgi:hypothetical protein